MSAATKTLKRSKFVGLEAISFVLRPLLTSLVSLLIIRLFSIELWGEFVFFLVAIELGNTLLNWGQKPFLLREFSLTPSEIGAQWSKAIYARIPLLFICILLLALIPTFRAFFFPLLVWILFRWFSYLFEPIVQFHRKYIHSIVAEIIALIVAVTCIVLFSDKMQIEILIYVFAFSSVAKCIVLSPLLKELKLASFSLKMVKTELLFSFPFFALSIAGLLQTKSDLYVVTYFINEEGIANYQVMLSFLLLGQAFSAIVLGPFQKNIYRWQGNDIGKLKRLYLKVGFIFTASFSIALYVILQQIYLIQLSAWYIILFFSYLFPLYAYFIESQILLKHKKEKQLLYCSLTAAGCNMAVSLLLVPTIGILGALLSTIVCTIMLAFLVVHKSKAIKKTSINPI